MLLASEHRAKLRVVSLTRLSRCVLVAKWILLYSHQVILHVYALVSKYVRSSVNATVKKGICAALPCSELICCQSRHST